MIARRDLIIGALCVGALGAGEMLKPRRRVRLLQAKLAETIPSAFGNWTAGADGDIILPRTPGSLSSRLYSDTVARVYRDWRTSRQVMLLVAYGQSQDDQLQLHRPESCYPAVGFAITERKLVDIPLRAPVAIPAVALTAVAGGRVEDILYWTRLGEALPQSAAAQRSDRLRQAMAGYVSDGVLVRASWLRDGESADRDGLAAFFSDMLHAVPPAQRAGLVGSERAKAIA